jgi:hypothetical protein
MELDLQSLFGLHVYSCTHRLRPRNSPPQPHLGSYKRAILVSQQRRHLFVTPWYNQSINHSQRGTTVDYPQAEGYLNNQSNIYRQRYNHSINHSKNHSVNYSRLSTDGGVQSVNHLQTGVEPVSQSKFINLQIRTDVIRLVNQLIHNRQRCNQSRIT